MKTSKVIHFDKLVSLLLERKEDHILAIVNGVQFIYLDGILHEEQDTLTVKQAKEIEAKYKKNEE
jgi:chaperone required for assembly of F1-ATPase